MLEIENLAEFQAGINAWLKEAEQTCLNAYRGLAAYAFAYVVEETPQYTGEAVANWRFSIGGPELSYTSGIKLKRTIKRQKGKTSVAYNKQGFQGATGYSQPAGGGGNPQAMAIARQSLRSGFRTVKSLDEEIFISNATHFESGGKSVGDLEDPAAGWLRAVNEPGHMIGRAVSYITEEFGSIHAGNLQRLMVMPA